MKRFFLLLSLIALISCSSDSDENDGSNTATDFDISLVQLEATNISTSGLIMNIQLNQSSEGVSKTEVLYRPSGTSTFLSAPTGIISALEKGKNYDFQARITIGGQEFTTNTSVYTTLGFNYKDEVFAEVVSYGLEYKLIIETAGFTGAATPFQLHLKYGELLLPITNYTIEAIDTIKFDISDLDVQPIFEDLNGDNYAGAASFTVLITSGDFVVEAIPQYQELTVARDTGFSRWLVFNKRPGIVSHEFFTINACIDEYNNRSGFITVKGSFWGDEFDEVDDNFNIPDSVNFNIKNSSDPSIEATYLGESMVSTSQCDVFGFTLNSEILDLGFGTDGFHSTNLINATFDPNALPPGAYDITVTVEKNGESYSSDPYNVILE